MNADFWVVQPRGSGKNVKDHPISFGIKDFIPPSLGLRANHEC